uniref:Mucin n=1 Tax=Rhipicephalus appendiculatus TaxID=34631 RepID=A0A131YGK1_RHIAP
MLKQWSRKFWLVALCAILCATMTAAEDDPGSQNEGTNNDKDTNQEYKTPAQEVNDTEKTDGSQDTHKDYKTPPQEVNDSEKTDGSQDTHKDYKTPPQEVNDSEKTDGSQDTHKEDNQNERTSEEAEASTHGYTDWDCIHHKGESKNGTHVYKKCALVCDGDQVSVVRNGELCWLNSTIATEELAAPKPIERSGEESAQGICKDQNCVPKEDDTQEVPAPK